MVRLGAPARVREARRTLMAVTSKELETWARTICSTVILSAAIMVEAMPWLGPDRNACHPAEALEGGGPQICCKLDASKPVVDFKFDPDLPMRTRRPAHKLDWETLSKYERAVALMKALPDDDPRSFHAQSKLHCGYALGSYNIVNSSEAFPVHTNWHFLPFHRWYLYFYERILAKLIGDDTLAIPFWAWDVQNETMPPANVIPAMFADSSSPLFDKKRSELHQPPALVNLDVACANADATIEPGVMKRQNDNILWQNLKTVIPPLVFYGRNNTIKSKSSDGFEELHVVVHIWTGSDNGFGEDMRPAYSSASDPIFFSHHSETDRLWEIWRGLGGGLIDDPDWLDSEYLFYDENADLVRVKVRDCLDNEKLRTSYEYMPADWLDFEPTSIRRRGDPKYPPVTEIGRLWRLGRRAQALIMGGPFLSRKGAANFGLGGASVTYHVARPKANVGSPASKLTEVLAVTMVVREPIDGDVPVYIFVGLPEADATTPRDCAESLGTVLVRKSRRANEASSQKVAMEGQLGILGLRHEPFLAITFVPAWDSPHEVDVRLEIKDLRVELHSMATNLQDNGFVE